MLSREHGELSWLFLWLSSICSREHSVRFRYFPALFYPASVLFKVHLNNLMDQVGWDLSNKTSQIGWRVETRGQRKTNYNLSKYRGKEIIFSLLGKLLSFTRTPVNTETTI